MVTKKASFSVSVGDRRRRLSVDRQKQNENASVVENIWFCLLRNENGHYCKRSLRDLRTHGCFAFKRYDSIADDSSV